MRGARAGFALREEDAAGIFSRGRRRRFDVSRGRRRRFDVGKNDGNRSTSPPRGRNGSTSGRRPRRCNAGNAYLNAASKGDAAAVASAQDCFELASRIAAENDVPGVAAKAAAGLERCAAAARQLPVGAAVNLGSRSAPSLLGAVPEKLMTPAQLAKTKLDAAKAARLALRKRSK